MQTVFDIAHARLKAVEETDKILARQREQLAELKQLRESANELLLDGTDSLTDAVQKYERELIRWALRASDKRIVGAARLLNVNHQRLQWAIGKQYPELLQERCPCPERRLNEKV